MAQGGASALEDAAVLARCLKETRDVEDAFQRLEGTRLARTARLQLTSGENTWGKRAADPSWVDGYDVWQTAVAAGGAASPRV